MITGGIVIAEVTSAPASAASSPASPAATTAIASIVNENGMSPACIGGNGQRPQLANLSDELMFFTGDHVKCSSEPGTDTFTAAAANYGGLDKSEVVLVISAVAAVKKNHLP